MVPPALPPAAPRPPKDWGDPGLALPRAGRGWHRVLAPVSRMGAPLAFASGSPSCPGFSGDSWRPFPHTGADPWPFVSCAHPVPLLLPGVRRARSAYPLNPRMGVG